MGAASRDVVDDDPRGWRLGGGVSYSALAVARLGLPTRAVIGVDREASTASELDLLREAGVDVHLVPLERGPVFVNIERPEGRLQLVPVAVRPDPDERGARGVARRERLAARPGRRASCRRTGRMRRRRTRSSRSAGRASCAS